MHRETARHREAFELWYDNDRNCPKVAARLRTSERTIRRWIARFDWHARADARDREIARRLATDAVRRRVEMIERHRKAAQLLIARGQQLLARQELRSEREAIEAIRIGCALERLIEGLPTWAIEVATADDATVSTMARKAAQELGLIDAA